MKKYPAIATVEFSDISTGTFTTDAMIKKSPVALLKNGIISQARYLVFIAGTTASVEESYNEALYVGRESVIDHVFLPDVDPRLYDAVIQGKRVKAVGESLSILETPTVSCNLKTVEIALKGTSVDLVEIRLADSLLNGKAVHFLSGDLHQVQAAGDLAVQWFQDRQVPYSHRIISSPHEALSAQVSRNTAFAEIKPTELDGEKEAS